MSKAKSRKIIKKNKNEEPQIADKSKNTEYINWLNYLQPKTSQELIVHPKKIEEIRNWFTFTQQNGNNRILVLTGSSGCSKATAIKVIANELGYEVVEWTVKLEIRNEFLMDEDDLIQTYKKQSEIFQDFLIKSSRFNSIFSQKDRLLIVKDFPNIFLRKGHEEEFWIILKKYKINGNSPLIFIITETNSKSLNIEYNLFPNHIVTLLRIDTINMNPISSTMMKKALKQVCAKMKEKEQKEDQFFVPTQSVIDDIVTQSQGDIRNAIMNLQLVCQKGCLDLNIPTTTKKEKSGKSKKAPTDKIDKGVGRDEVLGIFHGVGRALHPKKEENKEMNKMKLTHSPESVAECFSSQPGNYIELLHSNYLKTFSAIEDVKEFTNVLSLSDIFQKEYRNADNLHFLNLNLVIRAAMVCNSSPSKGFRPITGYASKKFKNVEEKSIKEYQSQMPEINNGHRIPIHDYFQDYAYYMKLIQTCKNLQL